MAKEEERERERIITVEYLESKMSSNLLHKFPDTSAFDFDYSQSAIWSPLLPRFSARDRSAKSKLGVLNRTIRKKISKKKLEFVPSSSPSPAPKKVWNKVVKVAKCFMAKGRVKAIRFRELS